MLTAPPPLFLNSCPADADDAAPGAPAGTPRPIGRLSIYTLLDDKVAEFDRLAERAAEGVRTTEPDTLVYVIHVVPKAPMQRIVYEIYRDRAAFESHERQPHIRRFMADRASCVLATNIIDLRLKYAKVAALGARPGGRRGRASPPSPAGRTRSRAAGQRGPGARPPRPPPEATSPAPTSTQAASTATAASTQRRASTAPVRQRPVQRRSRQRAVRRRAGHGRPPAVPGPGRRPGGGPGGGQLHPRRRGPLRRRRQPVRGRRGRPVRPGGQYGYAGGGQAANGGQYPAAAEYPPPADIPSPAGYQGTGYQATAAYQASGGYARRHRATPAGPGYSGAAGYQSGDGYQAANGYPTSNGYSASNGYSGAASSASFTPAEPGRHGQRPVPGARRPAAAARRWPPSAATASSAAARRRTARARLPGGRRRGRRRLRGARAGRVPVGVRRVVAAGYSDQRYRSS